MEKALHNGFLVLIVILIVGGVFFLPRLLFMFYGLKKQKRLPDAPMTNRFSILIPARNESKVIEGLLKSIKNQTYPQELLDVFVLVTSEDDPTVEISKRYGVKKVLVVPPDLNSKGKTLDICLKEILNEDAERYQAHFIVDADNVMSENFIENMNNVYCQGYQLAVGRRTNKTWEGGFISNSSFLTFSYVNTLNNKFRTRFGSNITISGSGFYISNDLVKQWGGFPFHSLTEDYELTKWACINDVKGYYNEHALIADEQPTKMKPSKKQRLRWIKGHNIVDNKENKLLYKQIFKGGTKNLFFKLDYLFSLFPIYLMLAATAVFLIFYFSIFLISLFAGWPLWKIALIYFLKIVLIVYCLLLFYTLLGMLGDRDIIKLSLYKKIALFFSYPVFMMSWVGVYIKSFFVKNLAWSPIEHNITDSTKK